MSITSECSSRQGINQPGGDVRHRIRQPVGVPCLADKIFRRPAVSDEADIIGAMHLPAKMFPARPAHVTFAAIQVGPESHTVADAKIAVAGVDNLTAKFMPHMKIGNGFRAPAFPAFHMWMSLPHTPQAETRIFSIPGAISGTGTCLISTRCGPVRTPAFIISCFISVSIF